MDLTQARAALRKAAEEKKITSRAYAAAGLDAATAPAALENIEQWLEQPQFAEYRQPIVEHIASGKWKELDDAFWTVIPFGTGGRRGAMYPVGCNAINDRTIGESAQGLADYVKSVSPAGAKLSCAIAYDTRHRSRDFAELCAGIMAAAGYHVWFLDDYRSTPQLSFLVRYKQCSCGIMVTASHNPPSDNAVKVYWSTGGQVLPPHDKNIIDGVMNCREIRIKPFADALRDGQVTICTEEVDRAYQRELLAQSFPGPRNLKVVFSPLHGVGASAVMPILQADGFQEVELFAPQANPDPNFTNVPGHVANPENPKVFDALVARAKEIGGELAIATDPDADRIGVSAPTTRDAAGEWRTFTGNQIGALLADYVLEQRKKRGDLTPQHYVVITLVTTQMIRRIAESYGVLTSGNHHVGYKYIGGAMDEHGPDKFVFGAEESHGYLVGQYARDKDGPVAAMLMAETAAKVKAEGKSLHEKLDALYWQHGYHAEGQINKHMQGSDGMQRMSRLMAALRAQPPRQVGGLAVAKVRDYVGLTETAAGGTPQKLNALPANMVILDLAEPGNTIAIRPSGTEPKVKFYMFTYVPAEELHDLEATKRDMAERMAAFQKDLDAYADSV